ncbi:MAG: nucleoside 2-deoxyribosyltransferase [Planctomycetales bacterium]|nr:nucleoside 2-deoxyribosyltransferase [Planctomycetales bacterium]MCB2082448.1 nucleoside 2-deoxyribosyltransferase [Sphingomonadaceae bacterium]
MKEVITSHDTLPSPASQSAKALRFVGDQVRESYTPIRRLPPHFHSLIGSPNRRFSYRLVRELRAQNLLDAVDADSQDDPLAVMNIEPTMDGWQVYESGQNGELKQGYGFVALKFGDEVLDSFLTQHVKPGLNEQGLRIIDLRDVSRAGVIDNIMREQIRDADFVLADLSHDNPGAYWEAGYAEGLGKPVVYICEKSKFDQYKTHFDTNHCTTVMWESDKPDEFLRELVATIKRSFG